MPLEGLEKLHKRVGNASARRAILYALLGLFVPLLGLVGVAFGVVALRHARTTTWPPAGGRGTAITGIVIGLFSIIIWALVAASILSS